MSSSNSEGQPERFTEPHGEEKREEGDRGDRRKRGGESKEERSS